MLFDFVFLCLFWRFVTRESSIINIAVRASQTVIFKILTQNKH